MVKSDTRDLEKAKALAKVVIEHLPHLSFEDTLTSDFDTFLPFLTPWSKPARYESMS
jgi:hypothetical protein